MLSTHKSNQILVSIIIVNYNGKHFLQNCLNSLANLDFPKDQYEIILVDNNSEDLSVRFVKEHYKNVKVIESVENLGFAGGCNLGVKNSLGEFIVLLNSDTKVSKNWLKPLVDRVKSDKNISAVNSKVLLFNPYIELTIKSDISPVESFNEKVNFLPVGVLLESVLLDNPSSQLLMRFRSGVYEKKNFSLGHWTNGEGKLLIPCDPNRLETNITLLIRPEKFSATTNMSILIDDLQILKSKIKPYETRKYHLTLETKKIKEKFIYAVQNAGLIVFKTGYGRDRGALVKNSRQYYEIDSDYFNIACEVNAFSGASVLIRKSIYEKVGGFDESLFMYYEDLDMSLKMKRLGYKIWYEPKSEVFHIHAGTSKEFSSFFNYHVTKNQMAILLKHFPLINFFKSYLRNFLNFGLSFLKMVRWRFVREWASYYENKEKADYLISSLLWVVFRIPKLLFQRWQISFGQKKTLREIYKELY